MSAFALISGTIFRSPIQKISKAGRPYTTLTVKVGDDSGAGDFWSVLWFSESAQREMLRLEIGEAVSVRGKMKIEIFEKDGQARISRSIFADAALGLRPARRTPKAKAAKAPTSQGQAEQSVIPPSSDLNDDLDDLPF